MRTAAIKDLWIRFLLKRLQSLHRQTSGSLFSQKNNIVLFCTKVYPQASGAESAVTVSPPPRLKFCALNIN